MARLSWCLHVSTFLGVVLFGTLQVPTPFFGDQALYLMLGELILEGGTPYKDLWDLKHPGIFLFYTVAGGALRFDEIGIHLFELLWMLNLALLSQVIAVRWFEYRAVASAVPAFTVGFYYAVAQPWHLTQPEALVGLPLLWSLFCAWKAVHRERRVKLWLFLSGLAGGVVIVFKLPYGVIPFVFWLLVLREWTYDRHVLRAALAVAPSVVAGTLLPVLGVGLYLVHKDALPFALWTYFVHPSEAIASTAIEPLRLVKSLRWFTSTFAPLLALGLVGAGRIRASRCDFVARGLFVWLGLGVILIVVQVISWWEYHFLLLLVPVGFLAARGVETLVQGCVASVGAERACFMRIVACLAMIALFGPQLGSVTARLEKTRRIGLGILTSEGVRVFQDVNAEGVATIRAETSFLRRAESYEGRIYVIDSPSYYFYSGRRPAISVCAGWFHPTDTLWKRMLAEFWAARPAYVRLGDEMLRLIVDSNPDRKGDVDRFVAAIERQYTVIERVNGGTWYIRRDLVK